MMRAVDIIAKKRDGQALTREEINWFVEKYSQDELPDYQAAAFLMAVCINGMEREETIALTLAMQASGQTLDLSDILPYAVDKHSSGGVGDKTSLVVLPLVASCGVPVAKMSGRGLGFSGGTLDKLESIDGFNVNLDDAEFRRIAREQGLVLAGQSHDLAPADGKFYALRDVTATVPSLPLIASSIMSKKLAAGANGIVLDVKVGHGAFMKTLNDARDLARIMVNIGVDAGRDMVALLSDMNQPLGNAVGNALEVAEAVETLKSGGPTDFREHCLEVASHMLKLAGQGSKWTDLDQARAQLVDNLVNGSAFDQFRRMVQAQGGDVAMVDDTSKLPQAKITEVLTAEQDGIIESIPADVIGIQALHLGAGREKKSDSIDHAVGLKVHVKVGDNVKTHEPLVTIHANDDALIEPCKIALREAIKFGDIASPLPLFYDVITGS